MQKPPKEIIVDRAVELWCRALAEPKYDNLGDGPRDLASEFSMSIASMLPKNNTSEVLARFGVELKKVVMAGKRYHDDGDLYWDSYLGVDYDPCATLAEAAKNSGLKMQFPWKTTMRLYDDCVSFRMGYGADDAFHYPLPNGKWLVTSLHGSDIDKVIEYVTGGSPSFTVDEPAPELVS